MERTVGPSNPVLRMIARPFIPYPGEGLVKGRHIFRAHKTQPLRWLGAESAWFTANHAVDFIGSMHRFFFEIPNPEPHATGFESQLQDVIAIP